MLVTTPRRCLSIVRSRWLPQRLSAHVGTAALAPSNTLQKQEFDIQKPLCKRPAQFEDTVSAVLEWRQAVLARISKIGNAFQDQDNGPSATELQLEVKWVLDDIIAEFQTEPDGRWRACSWRQLDQDIRSAENTGKDPGSWQVKLRAPMHQLHHWWHRRLEERVPFQYLVSSAHWNNFILSVGPGILIPRPETEKFKDFVEDAVAKNPSLAQLPWCDLGTGSGAIALAAASVLRLHNEAASVLAVDRSSIATAYAAANAVGEGLSQHITVLEGSWFDPVHIHLQSSNQSLFQLSPHPGRSLGGILSNPPYIPKANVNSMLQAEVGRHEPWDALDGGPGLGIDSLSVICQGAIDLLAPNGFLALETDGMQQAQHVATLLRQLTAKDGRTFSDISIIDDCFGVSRFVTAWLS